jgi:cytochrome c
MKFRILLLVILFTLLTACNFTLAEDVTPPPGYIAPTPLPTLVLYPERAPSIENGAAIYAVKCAPCHGETGLGDGPQGIQLGVTVPAFALPEIARPLSPAQMYTTVTRGVIERFMPPFASLNDQERWDVVAYVTTLHTTKEEVQKGKELFEANCSGCTTDYYKNQTNMSALSTVALARIVRLGNDEIKAFGENLSDDEMWAVAEYLRSLSLDASPLAQATAVPATQTPVMADAGTSSADGQSEAVSPVQEGFGSVNGSIDNKTGTDLPADMAVTLHGFDHDAQNPSSTGPVEVLTLEGTVNADGTFLFENVEMPENRIFTAEVTYEGVGIQSELGFVSAGQTTVDLPTIVLYKTTTDTTALAVEQLHQCLYPNTHAT